MAFVPSSASEYPSEYNFAMLGRDFGRHGIASAQSLAKPLAAIAMIPLVAAAGTTTTAMLFSTVTPLTGAVVMGTFASIFVYTSIALKALGEDVQDQWNSISSVTTLFLTNMASMASLSYLELAPITFSNVAIIVSVTTGLTIFAAIFVAVALEDIDDETGSSSFTQSLFEVDDNDNYLEDSSRKNDDNYAVKVAQFGESLAYIAGYIVKPLGLLSMIPLVAGTGAISANLFSSTVTPLGGAVILGSFGTITICSGIAISALMLAYKTIESEKNEYLDQNGMKMISCIVGLLATHTLSMAGFASLGIAPVAISSVALVGVGSIGVVLGGEITATVFDAILNWYMDAKESYYSSKLIMPLVAAY